MIIDAASIPSGEQLHADVCVVGAGPAGLTVARELGRRHRVVILESGDEQPTEPAEDTATSVGIPYPVGESRARAVGGTSIMWRVQTYDGGGFVRLRELDDIDFQPREWIPFSGWPITKSDLDDGYRRARQLFGLPSRDEAGVDAKPLDARDSITSEGLLEPKLFRFAPRTVFTEDVPRSLAEMPGTSLVKNATVVDICCDDRPDEVSALHVAVQRGHRFTVRARLYVLAAGGIDNARLLLMSRSRNSRGLGNATDLVGRFFMEHPHLTSGLFWPSDPRWLTDARGFAIHLSADHPVQWKYGLPEDVQRSGRLPGCVFAFSAKPLSARVLALRDGPKGRRALRAAIDIRDACRQGHLPPRGGRQTAKEAVVGIPYAVKHVSRSAAIALGRKTRAGRYTSPRLFQISAMAEQVPNPDSRVRLATRRDRFGLPEAELDWRLTDYDLDSIRRAQLLLADALKAGSFGEVESLLDGRDLPPGLNGGPHHMGTTRMHEDPKRGVVDADCRLHEAQNLYIAGSSVFPTGGYANPTLTIVALAFRLADHLQGRLR